MSNASNPTESNPSAQPPIARRDPTSTTLHGVTLHDDFRWMRDKSSPELLAYLNAENDYTAAVMAPTAELQASLYAEMLSHIQETDESVPYRLGDWFYSTRTVEGSQYPIHCRRAAANPDLNSAFDPTQSEQIILDVNQLAEGVAEDAVLALGGLILCGVEEGARVGSPGQRADALGGVWEIGERWQGWIHTADVERVLAKAGGIRGVGE